MVDCKIDEIKAYVEENIGVFHHKRIASLDHLKLSTILKRKNPYLFRAKNMLTAGEIVENLLNAHISSNEETIFGDWLEGLAIFINSKVYGGRKSSAKGIDLEFDNDDKRYIVSIKSGPNWGNSSQIEKMKKDFITAKKILLTGNSHLNIRAINGCCYGKDNYPEKGDYLKLCGQQFWNFISGNENLYLDIIEPLGFKAKEKNEEFTELYAQRINTFTGEFIQNYCFVSGEIDWNKIVAFNSAK